MANGDLKIIVDEYGHIILIATGGFAFYFASKMLEGSILFAFLFGVDVIFLVWFVYYLWVEDKNDKDRR